MPLVRPFRAVRFDGSVAGPLESLLAPPYDVISPAEARELAGRSPYNVVRLILPAGRVDPGDVAAFEAAARCWREWRASGVLTPDPVAGLYVSRQTYVGGDGRPNTRLGFYGLLELGEFGEAGVYRHEATTSAPKAHLWELLTRTGASFSPVFGLFADAGGEVRRVLEGAAAGPPDVVYQLPGGLGEELWFLREAGAIEAVAAALARTAVVIADGHHRYETRLRFARSLPEASPLLPGAGFTLAYLADVSGSGVEVLPTHRLLRRGAGLPRARVAERLQGRYRLVERLVPGGGPEAVAGSLEAPGYAGTRAAFAWYEPGRLLLAYGRSSPVETLRFLDEALFNDLPGGGREAALDYTHSLGEAVTAVDQGLAAAACLVRAVPAEEVWQRAVRGEVLPPKSTFFFPKLMSGLLIHDFSVP